MWRYGGMRQVDARFLKYMDKTIKKYACMFHNYDYVNHLAPYWTLVKIEMYSILHEKACIISDEGKSWRDKCMDRVRK